MINLVADILLPPASLAVLALVLIAIGGSRTRIVATIVLLLLIGLGVPVVATAMLNTLSSPAARPGPEPQAIVILSADAIRVQGPDDLDPGPLTLDRLRAGAAIARRTDLPMLVSGGPVVGATTTLAGMMQTSLRDDFQLQSRWQETRSRDTWENAEFSAAILNQASIKRIYLVTHDWHMRRSLLAFRHFGLDPVPVPVRPAFTPPFSWRRLIINPAAWFNSYIAFHEWLGLLYYRLRA